MTKREAAKKIAKLQRLARGSPNPHEAESAMAQAAKLAQEHGLGIADLEVGKMSAAFDELVDQVGKFVAGKPEIPAGLFDARAIIDEALRSIKNIGEDDKAKKLPQIVTIVRTAALFAGGNPAVSEVKKTIDLVLKNHELTI